MPNIKDNKKSYYFHFTVSDYSILTLDMIFNSEVGYGAFDYIAIYENNVTRGYLTSKGKREAYKSSLKLLNDNYFNKIVIKAKKINNELKKYKPAKVNSKNALEAWENIIKLNKKFGEIYRHLEQPFQKALEENILKEISEKELSAVISSNNFKSFKDPIKKHLEKLVIMGDLKLQIHKNAEAFTSDNNIEKYVSEKYKIPLRLVRAMRKSEILSALRGKIIVKNTKLEKRLEGCVFIKENKKWFLHTGKKFQYWKEKIYKDNLNKKIIGKVAYPGQVKGRVVKHTSWSKTTEINKNDILVTGMTNPQMIPLLKKAVAIITDEGGITCHAAIISRELKIPCIVGTKNATQILKNGDMIEVNANKGVIKKLENTRQW